MENFGNWERRWHPLLQEWVIVAAITGNRPWSGDTVNKNKKDVSEFDPGCYLCPGVKRASDNVNPIYIEPFAFTNDFSTFSLEAPVVNNSHVLNEIGPSRGICRVVCFSPKHNKTLAELPLQVMEDVYKLWKQEYITLGENEEIENVLIFENKGAEVGASNPHPHGQIYATNYIPKIPLTKLNAFISYYNKYGTHLLKDVLKKELEVKNRIVTENEHFVAFVPYFARLAYETYIVPKRKVCNIAELTKEELKALSEIHREMLIRYDNLFEMSFPNITILQNGPTDGKDESRLFHFHIEFNPPLRAPDKLKYFAGFETGGGNIINPVKPEDAAEQLRNTGSIHYKSK